MSYLNTLSLVSMVNATLCFILVVIQQQLKKNEGQNITTPLPPRPRRHHSRSRPSHNYYRERSGDAETAA